MTIVLYPSEPVRYDAGDSTTFWNGGPDIVYYADTGDVSSTSYDGTISQGATVELEDEQFFVVAHTAVGAFLQTTPLDEDDPTQPSLRSMLPINVMDFDVQGDNTTIDTQGVQAALDAAAGLELVFPDGTYVIDDSLTVAAGTRLVATGTATLRMTAATAPLFIVEGDDVVFDGLYLDGPYNPMTAWPVDAPSINARILSYAIRAWAPLSDVTGRPDVDQPLDGLTVRDCRIRYFGAGAVYTWHSHNQDFTHNEISDCGRDGIRVLSGTATTATHNHIHDLGPGYAGNPGFYNCYGFTFTRYSSGSTDTTVEPNCQNCIVAFNHIHDITSWNGIDSHGGRQMTVCFNRIERCFIPIGFDDGDSNDGTVHSPLQDIVVLGNTLDNTGLAQSGPGVNLGGSSSGADDLVHGTRIAHNTLIECGSNTTDYPGGVWGAIHLGNLQDALVSGNTFKHCYGAGVWLTDTVKGGLKIRDNTFEDVQTVDGVGAAIHSVDDTFSAHIAGNTYTRNTGSDDFNAYHWPTLAAGFRVRIGDGEINTQAGITKYHATEYVGPTGAGFTAPRAWARVTVSGGTATITSSSNIDSVTYNSAGNVTVSIDTNVFSDATTAPMVTILSDSDRHATVKTTGLAASGFTVITRDSAGTATDCSFVVVVFGVPA